MACISIQIEHDVRGIQAIPRCGVYLINKALKSASRSSGQTDDFIPYADSTILKVHVCLDVGFEDRAQTTFCVTAYKSQTRKEHHGAISENPESTTQLVE